MRVGYGATPSRKGTIRIARQDESALKFAASTKPMNSPELQKFFETASGQGANDQLLIALLRGRGWPEDEAQRAVADYYEARTGFIIPAYKRSSSAKDAFLYLVSFIALGTWSFGLGSVMLNLIDVWIKDPARPYARGEGFYQIADSLASIIIGFPVYLLATGYIVREVSRHPEKLDSAVRKWLTSMVLIATAAIALADLILFLTAVLRGELTANFGAKAAVVLAMTAGILWYYFGALQQKRLAAKIANE
jgi:Domain of unknown function (DUF5671)